MKLSDHIGKVAWSFADKVLFVLYGFLVLYQSSVLNPSDIGVFFLYINIANWIIVLGDAFALQGLIQFGANLEDRKKVNFIASTLHYGVTLGAALILYLSSQLIDGFMDYEGYNQYKYLIPLIVIASAPRVHSLKIIVRDMRYHQLFLSNLIFFGLVGVITFYFVFFDTGLNFERLILAYLSGLSISSMLSIIFSGETFEMSSQGQITYKKYLDFSIPVLFQSALHSAPKLLDIYILKLFTGVETVGIYATAKNLYRFFDEGLMAANGLIYPAAIKAKNRGDLKGLNDLVTKSVSFMLVGFGAVSILLWLGGAEFIINFLNLGEKYAASTIYFNYLLVGSFALPFTMLSYILNTYGKQKLLLYYVFSGVIAFLIVAFVISYFEYSAAFGLSLAAYNFTIGFLCYKFVKQNIGFRVRHLLRAFDDVIWFVKGKLK